MMRCGAKGPKPKRHVKPGLAQAAVAFVISPRSIRSGSPTAHSEAPMSAVSGVHSKTGKLMPGIVLLAEPLSFSWIK